MKIRVLFVCLGNICRSPLAETIFRHQVMAAGLEERFEIDSAGTGSWHIGELPDRRTREVALRHDCPTTQPARQVTPQDFEHFDVIIAMDRSNVENLRAWLGAKPEKVSLMMQWHPNPPCDEVPDPYYGELDGFEHVYELLVPACEGLLAAMKERLLSRSAP